MFIIAGERGGKGHLWETVYSIEDAISRHDSAIGGGWLNVEIMDEKGYRFTPEQLRAGMPLLDGDLEILHYLKQPSSYLTTYAGRGKLTCSIYGERHMGVAGAVFQRLLQHGLIRKGWRHFWRREAQAGETGLFQTSTDYVVTWKGARTKTSEPERKRKSRMVFTPISGR